jgi:hypothetical protein
VVHVENFCLIQRDNGLCWPEPPPLVLDHLISVMWEDAHQQNFSVRKRALSTIAITRAATSAGAVFPALLVPISMTTSLGEMAFGVVLIPKASALAREVLRNGVPDEDEIRPCPLKFSRQVLMKVCLSGRPAGVVAMPGSCSCALIVTVGTISITITVVSSRTFRRVMSGSALLLPADVPACSAQPAGVRNHNKAWSSTSGPGN